MDNWAIDFDQRRWEHNINSYYRWKAFRDSTTNEEHRKICQNNMDRIKNSYPQYKNAFED